MMCGNTVLITGGTGSLGKALTRELLDIHQPRKVIIFSRDELKQHEMQTGGYDDERLRYFIGDVRDVERLKMAMKGVDIVIHAAALKQVPACEYNPEEACKTNIDGARNIVAAAIYRGVGKVMGISTDKAVAPINLYGASKLVMEKVLCNANNYSGYLRPRFSCVRYGNVAGSRGSVIPLFQQQAKSGTITITDARMTRFWLTLPQAVQFVIESINGMKGGEVFVPRIPSVNVVDIAEAVAPGCEIEYTGIRPGEKLHESLDDNYTSDTNEEWLSVEDVQKFCMEYPPSH